MRLLPLYALHFNFTLLFFFNYLVSISNLGFSTIIILQRSYSARFLKQPTIKKNFQAILFLTFVIRIWAFKKNFKTKCEILIMRIIVLLSVFQILFVEKKLALKLTKIKFFLNSAIFFHMILALPSVGPRETLINVSHVNSNIKVFIIFDSCSSLTVVYS